MTPEIIAVLLILALAAFCEVRAHVKHDRPLKEQTAEVRRMTEIAKPLRPRNEA